MIVVAVTSLLLGCMALRLLSSAVWQTHAPACATVEQSRPQVAPYFTAITAPTPTGEERRAADEAEAALSLSSSSSSSSSRDPAWAELPRGERLHFSRTRRQLPQCIIIGVRKCGTRALLEFLNVHPRVQKAAVEVHFFDDDDRYALGLEWYRRRMPYSFPDQITVEKSPAYFVTPSVPERIRAMNSSIKLLLIVREPVTRTISDYTQIHSNKLSKGKPHEAFEALTLAASGNVNTHYRAVQISLYAHYLRFWFDAFSREQIHIVDGDQLVEDPFPELQKIEDFLGLEHRIARDNFYFNKTKGFFCLRNDTTEKCLGDTKGRKHPDVSPEVVRKLRRFFHPHNLRFYDMIGRNLGWPTE